MGEKGDKHTETAAEACERYVKLLEEAGQIEYKKMFGGYGIFESGVMFAIIDTAGRLFFRVNESTAEAYEQRGSQKHGKMPYYSVSEEVVNTQNQFMALADAAIATAHAMKKK